MTRTCSSRTRVLRRLLGLGLAATVAGTAAAEGPPNAPKDGGGVPKCASVRSEARYGAYGYDHLVEIENSCERALQCTVKTDVNPEPTQVRVGPKEKATVLTFRGSPAREFKADVRCQLDGASDRGGGA